MRIAVLIICLISSLNSKAQSTLQIGNREFRGLSTNTYGIMNSWNGSTGFVRGNRNATIYPTQAIGIIPNNATISAIKFYRDTLANVVAGTLQGNPYFKLYIKNTNVNTFSTAVTWQDTANTMREIFNGDPTAIVGNSTGWVTFPINPPLVYTGQNIMIAMEYFQTAACTGFLVWSYDQSSISPQSTTNYFDATQNRYNSPVTSLPFGANTTGSNIRHPSLQIDYTAAVTPLKLISFDVAQNKKSVLIRFETTNEINASKIEIQKSNDNKNWKTYTTIAAKNDINGATYQSTDNNPFAINYYRLKIIDRDEKFEYSATKFLQLQQNTVDFSIEPSPAKNYILVKTSGTTISNFQLLNADGKQLKNITTNPSTVIKIDISNLPAGVYFLQDKISNQTKRFIKN